MESLIISSNEQITRDVAASLQVRYPDVSVISIAEGLTAMEMLETGSLDLVVLDWSLPDIKPADFITKLREFSDTALIALAPANSILARAELLTAGADECATVPVSPTEFGSRVVALLRRTLEIGFKS
jgi:DNA-binding response OmpR family regulator